MARPRRAAAVAQRLAPGNARWSGGAPDTIIRAAERATADNQWRQDRAAGRTQRWCRKCRTRSDRIPVYPSGRSPSASEVIKVYAVGSAAIEMILHEEIMRCATVRIDERDAFQLTPASLTEAASIVAERLWT